MSANDQNQNLPVACEMMLWKRAHLDLDSVFGVEIAIYMYIKWRREVAGDGAIDFVACLRKLV